MESVPAIIGMPAACMSPTALREASTSFARNKEEITGGFIGQAFGAALFPDFLEILRDVFQVGVVGAVGCGREVGKLDQQGKRGDLPGVIGEKFGVKLLGFFVGVGIEDGLLPGALAEAGLARGFFAGGRIQLLLAQLGFLGRTREGEFR